jgi:two-component sensor histidine kinase
LLKEIHYRVTNNLQVISSLLDLHAQHFSDGLIRAAFTDSQHRIRSMALIHQQLYRSTDLARIDMVQYIQDLALSLLSSFGKVVAMLRCKAILPRWNLMATRQCHAALLSTSWLPTR